MNSWKVEPRCTFQPVSEPSKSPPLTRAEPRLPPKVNSAAAVAGSSAAATNATDASAVRVRMVVSPAEMLPARFLGPRARAGVLRCRGCATMTRCSCVSSPPTASATRTTSRARRTARGRCCCCCTAFPTTR